MSKISQHQHKLIAIDCGKAYVKVLTGAPGITETNQFTTLSTYMEVKADNEHLPGRITVPSLGIDAIIGNRQGDRTSTSTSKKDAVQRAIFYYAIGSVVENGDYVDIAITTPLSEYFDDTKYEEFRDYMIPDETVTVTVNNVTKTFTIDSIRVRPEGAGIIKLYPELFKDDTIIFDGGGLNYNVIAVEDGVLNRNMQTTLNSVGALQIREEIYTALKNERLVVKPQSLFEIMEQGSVGAGFSPDECEKSKEIIKSVYKKALNSIMAELTAREFATINQYKFVFTGGTSDLLRETILNDPKIGERSTVLDKETSRWANARAAMEYLRSKVK